MTKTMCEKDKEQKKRIRNKESIYKCKSCGETAPKEKHFCKPKKYSEK